MSGRTEPSSNWKSRVVNRRVSLWAEPPPHSTRQAVSAAAMTAGIRKRVLPPCSLRRLWRAFGSRQPAPWGRGTPLWRCEISREKGGHAREHVLPRRGVGADDRHDPGAGAVIG